jgi:Tetratricopeptide repeat
MYGQSRRTVSLGADHPDTHPDTLGSWNNLAMSYRAAGRTAEAIPLYKRTLADCERVLGADHPDTKAVRENFLGYDMRAASNGSRAGCPTPGMRRTSEALPTDLRHPARPR